ncbi:unnamed protein product [Paramecium octaurelia]|uniref:Proteasome subunit beta n=1 Tax=Paramecium octaurelia TaxID=43137 RepID=A0A8S1SRX0_PAROT|nr:unnamed protein product [Paramecium octaurelia]
MQYLDNYLQSKGGYDYTNVKRNELMKAQGFKEMPFTKTGTTIVGVLFDGGVVMAADTRATAGSIVADKNCEKLHTLAPNIWAAGAGTAADLHHQCAHFNAKLKLQRLNLNRQSRVNEVITKLTSKLFPYRGHIGVALIIGGIDCNGPQLASVSPHGNYVYHPFQSMGSGSLAALGILEAKFQDGLTKQQAIDLAIEAIEAGIFHDMGSGSNVDVVAITKDGVDYKRNIRQYNAKSYQRQVPYDFPINNTPALKKYQFDIEKQELTEVGQEMEIIE